MNLWAIITYRSGRSFSCLRSGIHLRMTFERKNDKLTGDRFIIRTYQGKRYRPRRGTDGVTLELDKEAMDQIVKAYKELF